MMKARNILAAAVVLAVAAGARADFELRGVEQLTVNTTHLKGTLWDTSLASIVSAGYVSALYTYNFSAADISGGTVGLIYASNSSTVGISGGSVGSTGSGHRAYDNSVVNISGGKVGGQLRAYNTSTVNISGGSTTEVWTFDASAMNMSGGYPDFLCAAGASTLHISGGTVNRVQSIGTSTVFMSGGTAGPSPHSGLYFNAYNTSTVNISGGSIFNLGAYDSSTVNISGGNISDELQARHASTVIFHGLDFQPGSGLVFVGDRLVGTGILGGKWTDGTAWTVKITANDTWYGATILAIPEPATLSLLALGGLALLRRRRR